VLTVVGAEHGLVQGGAAEGDGGQELLADPGVVDDLLDDLDEALAGGHMQRGLHPLVEVVAAARIRVQQGLRHGAPAVPHRLVQRGVAGLVGHDQRALPVLRPGEGVADEQLRHLQLARVGRQVQRGVAIVVPGDEQLLVLLQDLDGELGVAVQGGEVERRVELGRRGAEDTGILRIHQLPQARNFPLRRRLVQRWIHTPLAIHTLATTIEGSLYCQSELSRSISGQEHKQERKGSPPTRSDDKLITCTQHTLNFPARWDAFCNIQELITCKSILVYSSFATTAVSASMLSPNRLSLVSALSLWKYDAINLSFC
jgi:hypothetical protein